MDIAGPSPESESAEPTHVKSNFRRWSSLWLQHLLVGCRFNAVVGSGSPSWQKKDVQEYAECERGPMSKGDEQLEMTDSLCGWNQTEVQVCD